MEIALWLIQTTLGRLISSVVVGGIAWFGFGQYYEHKGAVKERAKFVQAGEVNAGKARKARRSVDKVSDESLFDKYLRD